MHFHYRLWWQVGIVPNVVMQEADDNRWTMYRSDIDFQNAGVN